MRIAIVGAGALGQIYGVRLAARHEVSWVVRPGVAQATAPFRIQLAKLDGETREDASPRRVIAIPADTDVALVTLRFDTLAKPDDDLRRAVAAPPGTMVVVLSPIFSEQHRALEALVGHPVVSAMPGVSGYLDPRGVVRHWVPAVAETLIDDGSLRYGSPRDIERSASAREDVARRERLVRALVEVGLPAHLAPDVAATDAATTIAFFPLIASIAIGGSTEGVLGDAALVQLVIRAGGESERLAAAVGKPAAWAGLLTKFVGPLTLKVGVGLARRLYPEAVQFVDHHFGPKLREQHLLMGRHILTLADAQGIAMPSLQDLVARLAPT